MPSASDWSSGSNIQEVSNESRPNTVMNHGAPAATTARSGCSGSKMRSAPRSSVLVAKTVVSHSSGVVTDGLRRRQSACRRAGWVRSTASPH